MPLQLAPEPARQAIKLCFEKNSYSISHDGLRYLHRNGVDQWAAARASIRHIVLNRNLYLKTSDDGLGILARQYHGEIGLFDDDSLIAYMHFILSQSGVELVLRAHHNCYLGSLPWN